MKKIRIKNLRSLSDTDYINIKPITVLVGKNSIGKSTFLRTFPLLKQTMVTNRSEPILWYSPELVDFGNFSESVNKNTKSKTIDLFYEFELLVDDFLAAPFFTANISWELIDGLRFYNKKNKGVVVNTKVMISVTEENISKIEELFPRAVFEGKVEFEILKQELSSEVIDTKKEKYELTWPGKKEAIVIGNTPTKNTLRPLLSKSRDFNKTKNSKY